MAAVGTAFESFHTMSGYASLGYFKLLFYLFLNYKNIPLCHLTFGLYNFSSVRRQGVSVKT